MAGGSMRSFVFSFLSVFCYPSIAFAVDELKYTFIEKMIGYFVAWIVIDIMFSLLKKLIILQH